MHRFRGFLGVSLVAMAVAPASLRAQEAVNADRDPATRSYSFATTLSVSSIDDPSERVDTRPVRKLAVEECVTLALKRNYDIRIEAIAPKQEASDIPLEEANFDPRLTSTVDLTQRYTPNRSKRQFSASGGITATTKSRSERFSVSGGLKKRIITGADLGVAIATNRDYSTVGSTAVNPYYSTDLTLSVTQPLLRGGWIPFNRSSIHIAYNEHQRSIWAFKSAVMRTLKDVQEAYWNLVRSIEVLRVSRAALLRAKRLYEENQLKAKAGTIAPIEVLQAEAEVAAQRETLIVALRDVENAEDKVKQLINLQGEDGRVSNERLLPTSKPAFVEIKLDREECLREARTKRPEYFMTELDLKNERLRLVKNKNELLPKLDLAGNLTWLGRGTNYGNAADMMMGDWDNYPGHTQYYDAGVRLTLDYPIGNRAAKSRFLRSQLQVSRRELERQKTDLQVQIDVRREVRAVLANVARVKANRVATYLARARLAAEEKKLSVGKSTSFDVLQAQEDLAVREREEVRAIVDYRISLVALDLAKGSLLETNNVFVAE